MNINYTNIKQLFLKIKHLFFHSHMLQYKWVYIAFFSKKGVFVFQKGADRVMLKRRIFTSKRSITASFYKKHFHKYKSVLYGIIVSCGVRFCVLYL